MVAAKNADARHEFLQIAPHDKFYSRLISKETSSTPSFRVYYGGASGAVPFLWESRPGTPKNTVTTSTLPPLTPPPSYHFNPKTKNTKKPTPKVNSLMHCILPRLTPKRTRLLPSSSPLSSPSVSSSGSSSSHHRSRLSSLQSSFDENELGDEGSPTSTLCSREHQGENSSSLSGCYSMVIMKNALLSIVGSNGSSQGTTAA